MGLNRIKGEFSKCCKTTTHRSPKLAGFKSYCDKCRKECELIDLQARILVEQRNDKTFKVTSMIPHRKIINVLITGEGEPFEISYLEQECELFY
ncbi:hypothetical protein ACOMCU_01110 [Lysinibacillus sp. UGB7]|uniref:hypothetical protein n=1 Tax=Lysinibacillus sp. UGB7 TaxID=3411039 RepID=UPI003B7C787A